MIKKEFVSQSREIRYIGTKYPAWKLLLMRHEQIMPW